MTENDSTPHPQDPAAGADFDESEGESTAGDERGRSKDQPLDAEARDGDIDITQSDGPVLEEGDDLDTGAGIHRHRP